MSSTPKRTANKRKSVVDDDSESEEESNDFEEDGGYRIGDVYIPPPPPPPKYSGDQTGDRLVITYIENIDFKSYAGRQRLGPFHKSFTSIVGPNGSGKSNVIDSMLFVFGYRAQKLRSKKLSVLIHNSDTFPNVQSCQVIVYFALINDKGGDDFDVIPNSEFTVSRSINKENVSVYAINGKKVQFKEVSLLLQKHGVDLRYNRFLILQGEVEQIALMKPKAESESETGMLEFLEDIIGSTRLKAPLTLLQEKVEETSVLRVEKFNRVKVVEKEKDALLEPRNEAILFLETENELTKKRNEAFHINKAEAEEVRAEAFRDYEKTNEVYKQEMSKIDDLKKSRTEKDGELKQWHEKYAESAKAAEELNEAFKDAEKRDTQLRSKIRHTKTKGKKLVEDFENEKKKLEELTKIPDKYLSENEEFLKRKEELEEAKKTADEHLSHVMGLIRQDTEHLQQQKDQQETELLNLQEGVNTSRSKLEVAQSELDLYLSKELTEKAKLEQLKFKFDKIAEELKQKQHSLSELKTQLPATEKKIAEISKEVFKVQEDKSRVSEALRRNIEKLEDARSALNAATSRNTIANALMEQKRLGNIKGVLGRLGDLGAIDQKFDVAISTACGALDNIVTDTMDDAQKCVRFLRDNNIGATTFIALDKMRRWEPHCRGTIETPENVSRLFDLVRVTDERVKPAFYFALRDTLVADNLTQATRIGLQGRKRWRVVTLKGEMVETSGAMSGGGRPMSGKMGSSVASSDVSEDELREMERRAHSCQSELDALKMKLENLNAEGERLCSDVEILKRNLPKINLEISEMEKQQTVLKQSIDNTEKAVRNVAPDPKRVKELEKKVEAFQQDYDKNAAIAEKVEKKIADLNTKINEIMEKKVGTAKSKVDSLKMDIEKVTSAMTKADVSRKTALRNIDKCKSRIEMIETEIRESEALIKSMKEDMKKIEAEAQEITAKYEERCNERDEFQQKVKQIQTEIHTIKEKETRFNSDNLDTKLELEKLQKVLQEKESEVQRWESKIRGLKLHEIEDKPSESLPSLSKEELENLNLHSVQNTIDNLDKELKKMKPNMSAIAEYRKKQAVYLERVKDLEEITQKRDMYKSQFEQLRTQRLNEFKEGFNKITRKLKEMYRTITLGGDAELEWIDSLDPFSEGINFAVRPNKKSWKRISNLSGGEKTLSSLALIFALHYYKPSPLYVMDEIDAALDFKNVSIVAHYIKQRTRNTQFIIISLRNNMYELANRLVGIYKTFNCTKSVTFNPEHEQQQKRKTVDLTDTVGSLVPQMSEATA